MVFFQLICCTQLKINLILIICNTDPSTKPGKHWVLFFFHNDTVTFFDSLGREMDYYGNEFINSAKRFSSKYQRSLIQTQPKNTSVCGQYCLYFAYKICNDEKMENIIKSMKSPQHVLNFVKRNFKFCKSRDSVPKAT